MLQSYIFDSFRENCQTVIFIDVTKAFDCVDHNKLISALNNIGIGEPFLSCLRSYQTNLVQWVTNVVYVTLNIFTPSSGAPIDAVLSPLMFVLFVYLVASVHHPTKLLIFVNDVKIFLHMQSLSECNLLQNDLQRLVTWSESLGFLFNIPKCSVMTFCRHNRSI